MIFSRPTVHPRPIEDVPLAEMITRYKEHNDKLAESLSPHVESCTLAELSIIVRETRRDLERIEQRMRRLEATLATPKESP